MSFTIGDSDKMILKASGIINKDATVFIGSGLPNTTSKYVFLKKKNYHVVSNATWARSRNN